MLEYYTYFSKILRPKINETIEHTFRKYNFHSNLLKCVAKFIMKPFALFFISEVKYQKRFPKVKGMNLHYQLFIDFLKN